MRYTIGGRRLPISRQMTHVIYVLLHILLALTCSLVPVNRSGCIVRSAGEVVSPEWMVKLRRLPTIREG